MHAVSLPSLVDWISPRRCRRDRTPLRHTLYKAESGFEWTTLSHLAQMLTNIHTFRTSTHKNCQPSHLVNIITNKSVLKICFFTLSIIME